MGGKSLFLPLCLTCLIESDSCVSVFTVSSLLVRTETSSFFGDIIYYTRVSPNNTYYMNGVILYIQSIIVYTFHAVYTINIPLPESR